jgi:Recombinase
VRELFSRYAAGESTVALASWLSSQCSPPTAAHWSAQTVRQLLMNGTYVGTQTFGRSSRGKHVRLEQGQPVEKVGTRLDNLDGALVRPGAVPAIVAEDLFRLVQARLASGRRRSHRKDAAPLPLSGLGVCGHCRGPLDAVWATNPGPVPKKRTARLICSNRHRYGVEACADGSLGCPHDAILAKVLDLLATNIPAEGAIDRIAALAEQQASEEGTRRADERDGIRQQLAKLDSALARAQDQLFAAPADLVEDYQAGARRARVQRDELLARLAALDAVPPPAQEVDPERFRRFWSLCQAAVGGKVTSEGGGLNEVLKELVERFTLHFKRDNRNRATLDKLEVELPPWLSEVTAQ